MKYILGNTVNHTACALLTMAQLGQRVQVHCFSHYGSKPSMFLLVH
jgi:hypothetical protein